jgi:hypothetical protein
MYSGLRASFGGTEDFSRGPLVGLSEGITTILLDLLEGYRNRPREIIAVYSHIGRGQVRDYQGLTFSRGIIKDVFRTNSLKGFSFNPQAGFGVDLEGLYDVVPVSNIGPPSVWASDRVKLGDLKVFTFEASAARESERCQVVQVHALPAFLVASGKVKDGRQFLKDIKPLNLGECFYRHEEYRDDL